MHMSWPSNYLAASFRDIPFDCLSTGEEVARATVAHSYPFKDGAEIEDLGLQATRHSVRAILFGLNAERNLQQLKDALDAAGAGDFVHPVYGLLYVVVDSYKPAFDADNTDSVALDISFIQTAKPTPFFDLAIPEAKSDALSAAVEASFAAATTAVSFNLRELLAQANNSRVMQLAATLSSTMAQIAQLSAAVQNSAQGYLDLPATLLSDMRRMMTALVPHLTLSGSPASLQGFAVANAQLNLASAQPLLAAGAPASILSDTTLLSFNAQLTAGLVLAQAAQSVLLAELASPLSSPAAIEAMSNTVRAQLQTQLDAAQALYPVELARPLIESLKNVALALQQLATQVIVARPPLLLRASPVSGNLRLIAHALYADHARAPELARLNPLLRQPNFIAQGEVLYAFAK
ncbi:MAG: DNA circularization N-terminal domain-containing protein [Sideroxydans sp.]|nr:DNA circularization N-terminal domain-containing protein [Sideroxydans sp.]